MVSVQAFVLAGGHSRRMGQDKALTPWRGQALAGHVAAALAAGGCAPVSLVGRQPGLAALGLPVLAEPEEGGLHPLFGVAAALDVSRESPLVLICPCDLPQLEAGHVAALLAVGAPCVARAAGRVHPLLAVLDPALAPRARALALAGGSARELCASLRPVDLPEAALLDANRPTDLPPARALR